MREQTVRWFDARLLRTGERTPDLSFTLAPESDLLTFNSGAPADAQNFRVHEFFVQPAPLRRFSSLAEWESRKQELLEVLRKKVLVAVPRQAPRVRVEKRGLLGGRFEEWVISSPSTVPVYCL